MKKQVANFIVNGTTHEALIDPTTTLLELLRNQLGLTGTKQGCSGSGNCGACTVLVDGKPILSCLTLAATVREKDIVTIEGLEKDGRPHPIQVAFVEHGAIQCGFCTPGMVLSAKALLDENPNPSREDIKAALAGNLCRCTGYVKIIDAVLAAAQNMRKKAT
jgi:aerobic carbon-monoxide dehydrogenase small subunit